MSESPASRIARYYDRKCAQLCVDCGAGLQEDDGVRCVECAEKDRETRSIYNASEHGRATRRKSDRSRYEARAAAGTVCRKCGKAPAPGKNFCDECREENTRAQAAYRARKKANVVVLATERRRRAAPELVDPDTAPELTTREANAIGAPRARILRALRFFEWATATDIWTALELPPLDDNDRELVRIRDAYAAALSREVKRGTVERRELRAYADAAPTGHYNLTDEGRRVAAELAKRTA